MDKVPSYNRSYTVLLVEDNADDAELFLRALQKTQLDLEIAINALSISNGTEGAAQLNEKKFDAIFLDIGMPPPDGMELAKQIRSSTINRTTPIVVITGAKDRGLMPRAFQAGANLVLFKPIDRARLRHLIQIAFEPIDKERQRLQREGQI